MRSLSLPHFGFLKKPNLLGRIKIAGFCSVLLGLIFGFYLTFPDEIIENRMVSEIESRFPVRMEINGASLSPLATIYGSEITIHMLRYPEHSFNLDSFSLSPVWSKLLVGVPGIKGSIYTAGGQLNFLAINEGTVELQGSGLLVNFPLDTTPATRFSGEITKGSIASAYPLHKGSDSQVDVKIKNAAIHGLGALLSERDSLPLGDISLGMTGKGTSFTIRKLSINGGALELTGTGSLVLTPSTPVKSRINIKLTAKPGESADATIISLLELLGTRRPDGSQEITAKGSLENIDIK